MNNLVDALRTHAQAAPAAGGDQTARAVVVAMGELGRAIEKMATMQAQSNQHLAQSVVQAVTSALGETKNELRVVAAAAGAAAQGHNAVASSFDQLNQTMRAPRKRVMSKDKRGNKSVIDKIDEGDEE